MFQCIGTTNLFLYCGEKDLAAVLLMMQQAHLRVVLYLELNACYILCKMMTGTQWIGLSRSCTWKSTRLILYQNMYYSVGVILRWPT